MTFAAGTRRFNLDLVVTVTASPETTAAWAALEKLVKNPTVLVALLRQAMIATLLKAYKRRFEEKQVAMRTMDQMERKSGISDKELAKHDAIRERYADIASEAERARRERSDPETAALMDSPEKMDKRERMGEHAKEQQPAKGNEEFQGMAMLGEDNPGSGGYFPKQKFPGGKAGVMTAQMAKFLAMLTDAERIKVHRNKGGILLGIAPLKEADALKTPHSTVSNPVQPFGILWRQLEFGTGIYARRAPSTIGGYRATSPNGTKDGELGGVWWFGRHAPPGQPRSGLRLMGSRPGNFLRSYSGYAYDSDAVAFAGEFQALLARAIRGA